MSLPFLDSYATSTSTSTPRTIDITTFFQNNRFFNDIAETSHLLWPNYALRPYQSETAEAILRAVITNTQPRQFAVVFARQSGKDEMLAQLTASLMHRSHHTGSSILHVTPTLKPQGLIARRRLRDRLTYPTIYPTTAEGNTLGVGRARTTYLTAYLHAQARGETATHLLIANEAQDISPARWDAVFDPMGASYNAVQVFSGTVWTTKTLLARQMAYLAELERKDGHRRIFKIAWEEIAHHVPSYGEQVRARIAQFGRNHPFIRTEYYLEELDDDARLFTPARRSQMQGTHPRRRSATPNHHYAILLDVAGANESTDYQVLSTDSAHEESLGTQYSALGTRDATALTVVEVDLTTLNDPHILRPSYRVVDRRLWVGTPHPQIYAAIADLARNIWQARYIVVDATGVGAGLAGFLQHALPGKVIPFVFTAQSKSQLGWDFLAVIESGRYKDYSPDGLPDTGLFWTQVEACHAHVSDTPNRLLRWSVEDPRTHDDLLISASLCALLDKQDWHPRVARGR